VPPTTTMPLPHYTPHPRSLTQFGTAFPHTMLFVPCTCPCATLYTPWGSFPIPCGVPDSVCVSCWSSPWKPNQYPQSWRILAPGLVPLPACCACKHYALAMVCRTIATPILLNYAAFCCRFPTCLPYSYYLGAMPIRRTAVPALAPWWCSATTCCHALPYSFTCLVLSALPAVVLPLALLFCAFPHACHSTADTWDI